MSISLSLRKKHVPTVLTIYFASQMILRAPDTAKVKAKMVYAGSKDALTRVFVGVSVKVNATDLSELTETIVTDACRKFA